MTPAGSPRAPERPWPHRAAIALLFVLHLGATSVFFSPLEVFRAAPLPGVDYPVHTHRVHVYRQALGESGFPWGYDPAVAAGMVVKPHRDLGSKPMQVLASVLWFLPPGTVVRLFLFVTVLSIPLGCYLAARALGLGPASRFWVATAAVVLLWLTWKIQLYLEWGLVSFVAASALSPWVLALFLGFLARPGRGTYLGFTAALALLMLLHPQGPWPLAPSLVLLTLVARPLSWPTRAAAVGSPLLALALNAFWLAPWYLGRGMPLVPEPPFAGSPVVKHQTYASLSELAEQVDAAWLGSRALLAGMLALGLYVLWRALGGRVAAAFAVALAWTLYLSYFGSFTPVIGSFQPVRFIVPAFLLMALPLGAALAAFAKRSRVPPTAAAVAALALLTGVTLFSSRGPQKLRLPRSPDPLAQYVALETSAGERLLYQSHDGYQNGGFEARALALAFGREIIGCAYPQRANPAQFLSDVLLGKRVADWTPEELREALERWGVSWVFTRNEEARLLLAETTGDPGRQVGDHHSFRAVVGPGRLLIGHGRVEARVNRIELRDLVADDGLVVLRYRYHPAWRTDSGVPVESHPVPEDPAGFIALRNPSPAVTLRFDPWRMLSVPWPEPAATVTVSFGVESATR